MAFDGHIHTGWRRHMRWARESSRGVLPPGPDWRCIPIQDGVMGLKAAASLWAPHTQYGGFRRAVLLPELVRVAGAALTLAWPQVMGYLLDAAVARVSDPASPDYQDLPTYSVDFFTPADARRCRGVVVERLRLVADPAAVALALDLRAWKEEANEELTADDFDYEGLSPVPFRLLGAQVSLDGKAVADVETFTLSVRNELSDGPNAGGAAAWLIAARRSVRLELTKLDATDLFNAAVREGVVLSFSAAFGHPEGHELTLSAPVLCAVCSDEDAPPQGIARTRAVLEARTDAEGRDVTYALTLV